MKNAQRLAFATCAATIVLIGVGVFVRASGSGLGCPDWPTCHGGVVPPDQKHAWIEFSHRFTASVVGLLVIATAAFAWRHFRQAPLVLWAALLAVPLVGIQGLLGALTVVKELPPEIVATHLLTAMVVLTLELTAAIGMYLEDPDHRQLVSTRAPAVLQLGKLALATVAWLAVVMWVGAYMTESGATTACESWPTCNGSSVIPGGDDQEITHMLHRYLAGALVFFIVPLAVMLWRRRREVAWAAAASVLLGALYFAQVAVGAINIWLTFPDWLTVSHTVIASCIWATLVSTALLAFYRHVPEAATATFKGAEAPA